MVIKILHSKSTLLTIILILLIYFLYVRTNIHSVVKFSLLNITEIIVNNSLNQTGLNFIGTYEVGSRTISRTRRIGDYSQERNTQSFGPDCDRKLELQYFGPNQSVPGQIFFLETSGRSWLTPRQACTVESAAKFSGLVPLVLFSSPLLDLSDNSTCQLYQSNLHISFFKLNITYVLLNTPLEAIELKLNHSKYLATHTSDAMRLALVFKYGGFYSDLDAIVLQDLTSLKNIIGATKVNDKSGTLHHLANGEFTFEMKHQLLWETMKLFSEKYTGNVREEVGPRLITEAVKKYLNITEIEAAGDSPRSSQMTILPTERFYPVKAFEKGKLWPVNPHSFEDWSSLFFNSSMVHFYGSQTNKWLVNGDPSYEAYSVLAPRYCPMSFGSSKLF